MVNPLLLPVCYLRWDQVAEPGLVGAIVGEVAGLIGAIVGEVALGVALRVREPGSDDLLLPWGRGFLEVSAAADSCCRVDGLELVGQWPRSPHRGQGSVGTRSVLGDVPAGLA